jgi:hypothetical protein
MRYVLTSGGAPVSLHALVLVRGFLRCNKQYADADLLLRLLEACGCQVDDKVHTWVFAAAVRPRRPPLPLDAPRCTECHASFASRNQLFRHLRDPTKTCGKPVSTTAGQEAEPLPQPERRARKKKKDVAGSDAPEVASSGAVVAAHRCLWFGNFPASWAASRPLEAVLYAQGPRGLKQPWVKKVVRRPRRGCPYAIVAFRDHAEAELVLAHMDGLDITAAGCGLRGGVPELPAFTLKVRRCENEPNRVNANMGCAVKAGVDPPLEATLRPLSVDELWSRAELLSKLDDHDCAHGRRQNDPWRTPLKHEAVAAVLAAYATAGGRQEMRLAGRLLPASLRAELENALVALRWPARSHREHVTSERYLVLHPEPSPACSASSGAEGGEYDTLRTLCARIAELAGDDFAYSGIAVTKNFVGSPHVDAQDTSPQLAVSLGDFEGGELCVDGGELGLYVVETRGRVAKVDGRHVHWVRSYSGGDRYSIILYDTTSKKPTSRGLAVDLDWLRTGHSLTHETTANHASIPSS